MEETAAEHASDQAALQAAEQASHQQQMRAELDQLEAEYSTEPPAGSSGVAELMLELPTGERVTRRFR
jgi:hypothetical protein